MDFAIFKAALGLLFFGAAIGFGLWQLAELRKLRTSSKRSPNSGLKRVATQNLDSETNGERE